MGTAAVVYRRFWDEKSVKNLIQKHREFVEFDTKISLKWFVSPLLVSVFTFKTQLVNF